MILGLSTTGQSRRARVEGGGHDDGALPCSEVLLMIGAILVAGGLLLPTPRPAAPPAGSPATTSSPDRFAIVVGQNQPDLPDRAVLRYADDDALATFALLQ